MRVSLAVALALAAAGIGYAVLHSYRLNRPAAAKTEAASAHAKARAPVPHASPPNESAELAELRRTVARLGDEVAVMRAQASRGHVESGEPPDPMDPETEATLREERRAHIADLEANFVAEPRDSSWSSATYNAIVEALNANELRDAARSIECRSQTCRVEIVDKGPDTNGMIMRATRQLGQTLPTVEWDHVDDGNGRRSKVLYLSRHVAGAR
jgi:hypothetical protein